MFGSTDCSFLWWPIKLSAVLLVCNNAQFRITFLVFTLVNCSVWIIRLLFSSNYKTACCHDWEEGDCPKITATQDCKSLSRSLGELTRRRLRAAQKYQVLNCKSKLHVVLDLGSETEMDKSKFAVFDLMRQRWARDKSTREMGKRWTRAHLEPFCSWPDCSSLSKEPDGHQCWFGLVCKWDWHLSLLQQCSWMTLCSAQIGSTDD